MNLILQAIKSLFRKVENSISQSKTALGKRIDALTDRVTNAQAYSEGVATDLAAEQTAREEADATKMNTINPVGTGSFSMNRLTDSPVGEKSVAMGKNSIAFGKYSVAIGQGAVASRINAISLGSYNVYDEPLSGYLDYQYTGIKTYRKNGGGMPCYASNEYSFDEETGLFSLLEATLTTYTDALANGFLYTSPADNVRADTLSEIWLLTSTSTTYIKYRYRFGRSYANEVPVYSFVVGNGISDTSRSNCFTINRGTGAPWFEGRPQFGGNAEHDGSQAVMANGDTEIILASSTADSTKQFKITVDDTEGLKVGENGQDDGAKKVLLEGDVPDYSAFPVAITETDGVCSADKTFEEIKAAFDRGRQVYCRSALGIMQLIYAPNTAITFGKTELIDDNGAVMFYCYQVLSDNTVEKFTYSTSKLPNPYALTVNGQTYDGSKAVDIEIEGSEGSDGFSPTVSISGDNEKTTVVITDAEGEKSFDVYNGKDGAQGPQGEKGETGEQGPQGEKGSAGVSGADGYAIYVVKSLFPHNAPSETEAEIEINEIDTGEKGYVQKHDLFISVADMTLWQILSIDTLAGTATVGYLGTIKGLKGDTGAQGPQGEKGETGAAGADGKDGATAAEVIAALPSETWTFTLADGSTLDKVVPLL